MPPRTTLPLCDLSLETDICPLKEARVVSAIEAYGTDSQIGTFNMRE